MKKTRQMVAILFAVLMILSVVGGCAKTPATAEQPENTASTPAEPPAKPQDVDVNVGEETVKYDNLLAWYYPFPHPFGEACKEGIEAYVRDTGINVKVVIGPEFTMSSELENIEALVSQGYRHFGVFSVDAAAANGMYDELTARGCTFNNLGWDTAQPTAAYHLISTNIYNSAVIQMESLAEFLGYKGNIMIAYESLKDSAIQERRAAVNDVLEKYPDLNVVAEVSDVETVQAATMKIEDTLNANAGNINGIISLGFTCTQALITTLSDYYARGGEKIYCVGIDTDDMINQAITSGVLDATVAQNAFGIGYISGEVFRLQAEGYKPKEGKYHIDTGIVMVTKDNLNSFNADLESLTKEIIGTLTTEYMEK